MAKLIHTENVLASKAKSIKKIFEHEQSNIVNIQLKAGEGIPAHDSKHTIFIIVRQGGVKFFCTDEEYVLHYNDILSWKQRKCTALKRYRILIFSLSF